MGKHSIQKRKNKIVLKNPKKLLLFFAIIIILLLVIKIKENNKQKTSFELALLINNEDVISQLEKEPIIKKDTIFLSFEDIKKTLDSNLYLEGKNILMSSDKKIAILPLNSNNLEINGSSTKINNEAYIDENKTIYIPISELKNVYDIDFSYIPEYKNIVIDSLSKKQEHATAKKNTSIREAKNNSALIIEKIKKEDKVVFISEEKGWAKVRTQNGNIGFVKKNSLYNFEVQREEFKNENKTSTNTAFKVDISNKNLKTYEKRKKVIEQILFDVVSKKQRVVKIICNKEKRNQNYNRFILEATAILKESGITVEAESIKSEK